MLAFGSGTVPALLLVAFFADLFTVSLRQRLVRVSGLLLALLGGVTLYRGFLWLASSASGQHHMHRMF
jgi:sulfite exporter TauE/SafE